MKPALVATIRKGKHQLPLRSRKRGDYPFLQDGDQTIRELQGNSVVAAFCYGSGRLLGYTAPTRPCTASFKPFSVSSSCASM